MTLTIAYVTAREDPKIEWFSWSLGRELEKHPDVHPDVIVVSTSSKLFNLPGLPCPWVQVPPKPTVWQGASRLTKVDWFAASNARNTALLMAKDGFIAYVDDLSVLTPGWLDRVLEAMKYEEVTAGSYQKVKDLVVEKGRIISFTDYPQGHDNRRADLKDLTHSMPCSGGWLYGCSLVSPVEALLDINGWPEVCDGLGFEDCITGILLEKRGWAISYDPAMMTLESEELHHIGPVMKKSDYGVTPKDKSHRILEIAQKSDGWLPGYWEGADIRKVRGTILDGSPFPPMAHPEAEWYTGTLLKDL